MRQREIEENLWRAIRHGMDGEMIDFRRRRGGPDAGRSRADRRLDRAGARRPSGSRCDLPERNGAQRA